MKNYDDKDERLKHYKRDIEDDFSYLHPTDEAVAYRELSKHCDERATECEERNDREGVPER